MRKEDEGRYLLEVATSNSVDSWGMMRLSSRSLFLEMYGSSSSSHIIVANYPIRVDHANYGRPM